MYRSCEIFESRCRSNLFRHIVANQGLEYYTDDLRKVIRYLMIFGYAKSGERYDVEQ